MDSWIKVRLRLQSCQNIVQRRSENYGMISPCSQYLGKSILRKPKPLPGWICRVGYLDMLSWRDERELESHGRGQAQLSGNYTEPWACGLGSRDGMVCMDMEGHGTRGDEGLKR